MRAQCTYPLDCIGATWQPWLALLAHLTAHISSKAKMSSIAEHDMMCMMTKLDL